METMPQHLNVTYAATFNVEEIVKQLREDNRDTGGELEITLDDVIESVIEGFRNAVTEAKARDITITDQDGDEL